MHWMLKSLKVDHGLTSVQMAKAPDDYYEWDLQKRMSFLKAPSIFALCKTIVMKNSAYREENKDDPYYPRFIVVITQYADKFVA
jgi:hypothetical protein